MLRSMFFLTALLVSSCAAVDRPGPPPARLPQGGRFVPLPNWPTSASQIAADAQRVANANQPNPAYEWLFKPSDSTEMAKVRSLQRHNSLLNALRARQLEQKSAPESLTNILTAQLQEELDFFLYQCVFEAVFDKSVIDVPQTAKQCEEEFTVHFGADEQHEMKGVLDSLDDRIKKRLNLNYEQCRKKGNSKAYCKYQTTIKVNGKTIKARTGFVFEMPSLSDVWGSAVRSFSNQGQPGTKRPGVFRGGARPGPVFVRPP